MSSTVTLNKTFEIELEDNTTINVMVCLEASTEDEDYQASRQIKIFNHDNVLDPLQDALTELLSEIVEDDDDDPEQQELEVIEFYKAGGYHPETECAE